MTETTYVTDADDLSDFPVSEYYRGGIKEARTISRSGSWWAAVLLIEDPATKAPFLAFYRWQRKDGVWKVRKSFNGRSKRDAVRLVRIVQELSASLG